MLLHVNQFLGRALAHLLVDSPHWWRDSATPFARSIITARIGRQPSTAWPLPFRVPANTLEDQPITREYQPTYAELTRGSGASIRATSTLGATTTSVIRQHRRPAPSARDAQATAGLASRRAAMWDPPPWHLHGTCRGRPSPARHHCSTRPQPPSLNKPLQRVLSEYIRRTQILLLRFVELLCGQSTGEYRPNKNMLPNVLRRECAGYRHADALITIASSGTPVPLTTLPAPQGVYPTNHKSAADRYAVLVRNIRKEQDRWRCLVVDLDILEIWPEVHISPFGVVDKGDADPQTSGRTIHDLSFSTSRSINDFTDTDNICTPTFDKSDIVAREILRQKAELPGVDVKLQAGDVASAFRNVCTNSEHAHKFGGRLEKDNALVIETAAAFGWSGSPGAIAYIHGSSVNRHQPSGLFNYYWVDDHINVASDIGQNCADAETSLRNAMVTILGPDAINEEKITAWCTRLKILGLMFDTAAETVAMPQHKIDKAKACVAASYHADSMSRSDYRSLLGRFRHVATCVRPARLFLQRLRQQEQFLHRWQRVQVTSAMKQDLIWWFHILQLPLLHGFFQALPPPAVIVEMDASDSGLYALVLRYAFQANERHLIEATKARSQIGFDINYRELLSCAFAAHVWRPSWTSRDRPTHRLQLHVQFRIDNTSAVGWQTKMSSRNPRAQTIIRLLGHWEAHLGLRFSFVHIAGVENIIADAGSRSFKSTTSANLFDELTRDWTQIDPGSPIWSRLGALSPNTFSCPDYIPILPPGVKIVARMDYPSRDSTSHADYVRTLPCTTRIRDDTIASTLHGIRHFFRAACLEFPSDHPQIRMLLKGITRIDPPIQRKAPVSLRLLESCFAVIDLATPSGQALWGFCWPLGKKFAWFALKDQDIAVLDRHGAATTRSNCAVSTHIRLIGSKANQRGPPTLRMMNRSGHAFLCPIFGALCLLKSRQSCPPWIPAALFVNNRSQFDWITAATISRAICEATSQLGHNTNDFSIHSLRSGGATHMYRAGVDALTIQFHGRWASDTFKQYTRLCKESVDGLAAKIISGPGQLHRLQ
ncbi:LOW QUALITY PROTEIN: hypothetical protein PHMEG_00021560 [Phytophthora megakarya]|uniref:Tyr recombinase domain-containing protein n=1 Tax=Phytophthora megakarya TaxID=4795 RepID=A0A225VKY9_9STRA|nr:LOW QUALITY PROTEIN: hypothetical protein PHMEG_00021560 [Phytophthora megakarya]